MSTSPAPSDPAQPAIVPDSPIVPAESAPDTPEAASVAIEPASNTCEVTTPDMETPPVIAEPPVLIEPPLLAASALPPVIAPRLGTPWIIALVIVGLLQIFLGFKVPSSGPLAGDIGFRIGTVVGGTAFWPL